MFRQAWFEEFALVTLARVSGELTIEALRDFLHVFESPRFRWLVKRSGFDGFREKNL